VSTSCQGETGNWDQPAKAKLTPTLPWLAPGWDRASSMKWGHWLLAENTAQPW
jgi:hypothetical protein